MTVAALSLVLLAALVLLAVVLNHSQARLALVELTLNEGLPPGHGQRVPPDVVRRQPQVGEPGESAEALETGVHIFLSRNCHACQRLIEELRHADVDLDAPLNLRYVDRPRPIASAAADHLGATLHDHQNELASGVGADPLPFTIAVGPHRLASRAVTPTVGQVLHAARDAGIRAGASTPREVER